MKCPRCQINPPAYDHVYGVIPCQSCRDSDNFLVNKQPEFYSLNRMDRVQRQRDKHDKDMIQPFIGNKPNPDFAKAYPDKATSYFTDSELKEL